MKKEFRDDDAVIIPIYFKNQQYINNVVNKPKYTY